MGGISFDRKGGGGGGVQNNHRAGERGRGAPHYGKPGSAYFLNFFKDPKIRKQTIGITKTEKTYWKSKQQPQIFEASGYFSPPRSDLEKHIGNDL